MKRNPIKQSLKDPEKRAKLYLGINLAMIMVTFLIVIGTILFILILVGIIH
ncbi:MAG: hypothetical protein MJ232_01890 [archaeon]|nr:hypothetical protein [archaeon]